MWFPERAMIRTPTLEDAERLAEILQDFGMREADTMANRWDFAREKTGFDYLPDRRGFEVWRADLPWYESNRATDDVLKLIPDDCWMLTVDEFIQMCELEDAEETDIDFDSIL